MAGKDSSRTMGFHLVKILKINRNSNLFRDFFPSIFPFHFSLSYFFFSSSFLSCYQLLPFLFSLSSFPLFPFSSFLSCYQLLPFLFSLSSFPLFPFSSFLSCYQLLRLPSSSLLSSVIPSLSHRIARRPFGRRQAVVSLSCGKAIPSTPHSNPVSPLKTKSLWH